MKIGVVADTHDNLKQFRKAVNIFNRQKVSMVLHAGDYVAPFTISVLEGLNCPWLGVFGNNDGERIGLYEKTGGKVKNSIRQLEYGGRKILLTHYPEILDAIKDGQNYDIVIYGHTHKSEIKTIGNTLILNPGECCGWLYGKGTCAIVDIKKMKARIISL